MNRKVVSSLLQAAVNTLQKRDREIIEMRYYKGMAVREIAEQLASSQSRVSQLNHRILAVLRVDLEKQDATAA